MSARLPGLKPSELDESQRSLYDAITRGDRAKGAQHFPLVAADGSLNGPFGVMLHAPGVATALQDLGACIRFHTDLGARIREIAILQVAHACGSAFEWWAHERVGRAVGLTEEELMQLSLGSFSSGDAQEDAAAKFCANLLSSAVVEDNEYEEAVRHLSVEQLIELTVLVGYYRTLAQLMEVFAVGVPSEEPRAASMPMDDVTANG